MNVKKLRMKLGVSQQKFAFLMGVTLRTVQNLELKGDNIPYKYIPILERIERGEVTVPSDSASYALNFGESNQNNTTPAQPFDTDMFVQQLAKQQDIMARQLEELATQRVAFVSIIEKMLAIMESRKNDEKKG